MSAIPAFVFCLCFLLGQSSAGLAADFTGPVVSDLDGDTIEVLHNGQAEPIRLNRIDCPEKDHTLEILVSVESVGGNPMPQLVK